MMAAVDFGSPSGCPAANISREDTAHRAVAAVWHRSGRILNGTFKSMSPRRRGSHVLCPLHPTIGATRLNADRAAVGDPNPSDEVMR
jgi:hypothetical protein